MKICIVQLFLIGVFEMVGCGAVLTATRAEVEGI